MNDEIVTEVRKHRAEILEAHGWDVEKMLRSMMASQERRGRTVVTLEKKELQPGVAANAYPLHSKL